MSESGIILCALAEKLNVSPDDVHILTHNLYYVEENGKLKDMYLVLSDAVPFKVVKEILLSNHLLDEKLDETKLNQQVYKTLHESMIKAFDTESPIQFGRELFAYKLKESNYGATP